MMKLIMLLLLLVACSPQVITSERIIEYNNTVIVKEPCNLRSIPCQEVPAASPIKSDTCLRNETELDRCVINQTIHGKTSIWGSVQCKEREVAMYWRSGICSCEKKRCA